jgi:8-oxo-dGTP diphosphatase
MPNRNISVTVECFVEKDGKYLMLKRHPSKRILPNVWIAPGGHIEFCEGLISCTRREIKEETGLDIKDVRIRAAGMAHLKDIDQEFSFHILTASYAGGELITDSPDGELVWLSPEELLSLDNILAELKPILPRILDHSNDVFSVRAVYEKGNELAEFEVEDPS